MISQEDKKTVLKLISEACKSGARKSKAAQLLGLTIRTLQRWNKNGLLDSRKGSRAAPGNKLPDDEKTRIANVLESPEFAESNPNQIVPRLADQGIYLGSESTMYRILRDLKMNKHRQSSLPAKRHSPDPLISNAPNQSWSWDITYLPSTVRGRFFYLYMVMDLYSRKAVACQVYEYESGDLAAELITDACNQEKISEEQVTLHSDNGSPMKSATMLVKLQDLGVIPSFSRPSISNDNPYSESLFRTLKYRPEYPDKPFENLFDAREWANRFIHWYNKEHLHSGINYVTPEDRHNGRDIQILKNRHHVYQKAKTKHPERWSKKTRNWKPVTEVVLKRFKKVKQSTDTAKRAA
ncbi:transposase [Desulfobacula toluolica Tol2]|uniref:Transposase n=1 Tax=Desulfobacula toluolica (strain DSM 7467 / Tol2) TaxID=651182 RepID=K0NHL4_DESTT|nr:transposase [Desulfobacula toluolica Tol2]